MRTAERLVSLIAVFCIVSWRVFWMTMLNRSSPNALPQTALTDPEIRLLDRLVKGRGRLLSAKHALALCRIAPLGGFSARANDPPSENTVIWRGLSRLTRH
ncbi:hypothetical protein H8A99_39260 [Bradyrhizobium sp. Arg68]|uniref:hypothetical protein n=1 Tax=Bradyrhizobium ivorense TaxID=2511166 RepID=UPI001E3E80FE|nr:hypothetical protein [Bradyrhizobium ivorense]MCC8942290.1 hypothetical protein [Bradyrhizobium ivorense]